MDSLKDILATKNLDEPTEVTALRDYVQQLYQFIPQVKISEKSITVVVPNSKMASELRLRQIEIERRCQLTKRLYVKIDAS
jgi:hypothetical protein